MCACAECHVRLDTDDDLVGGSYFGPRRSDDEFSDGSRLPVLFPLGEPVGVEHYARLERNDRIRGLAVNAQRVVQYILQIGFIGRQFKITDDAYRRSQI